MSPLGPPDISIPGTYLLTLASPSQTALVALVRDVGFRQQNVILTPVHSVNTYSLSIIGKSSLMCACSLLDTPLLQSGHIRMGLGPGTLPYHRYSPHTLCGDLSPFQT